MRITLIQEWMARRKAHYWTQGSAFHQDGLPAIARRIYTMVLPFNHDHILTNPYHDFARYRRARCARFLSDAFSVSMSRLLLIPEVASALRVQTLLLRIGLSELRVVLNSLSYVSR